MTFCSPNTRAMPSPTLSTWPVSATLASLSKLAICCFRISEISAGRISMVRRLPSSRTAGAAAGTLCLNRRGGAAPTRTTTPPSRLSSTRSSMLTRPYPASISRARSCSRCTSDSRCADDTCAITTPRFSATRPANATTIERSCDRRRLLAITPTKSCTVLPKPCSASTAVTATRACCTSTSGLSSRRRSGWLPSIRRPSASIWSTVTSSDRCSSAKP